MLETIAQIKVRERLKDALLHLDMSYEDADIAAEVYPSFFKDRLQDSKRISLEDILQICKMLNISADYLLGLSDILRPVCYAHKSILSLDERRQKEAMSYIRFLHSEQESDYSIHLDEA